jgi:hypothetical protein
VATNRSSRVVKNAHSRADLDRRKGKRGVREKERRGIFTLVFPLSLIPLVEGEAPVSTCSLIVD